MGFFNSENLFESDGFNSCFFFIGLKLVRIVVLRSLGGLTMVAYNAERKGNKKSFSLSLARSSVSPQVTCDYSSLSLRSLM